MIIQILLAAIFFSLGVWRGYVKSQEHFGAMMERGEVMYKSPNLGWLGHPDAFTEIRNQEDDLTSTEAALINRVVNKTVKRIKKDKK